MLAPAILPAYVSSAARIVRRRVAGPRRFQGDAAAICRAIVEACWTGDYLAASAGHFRQFWTRDLAFSAGSLVRLGHRARVEASLDWALEAWSHRGRVTTTIFAGRRPADVYRFGVDSLPLLLATMEECRAEHLIGRHGRWMEREVARYAEEVLDARTGLVRDGCRFSTHRDTVITGSNCYANTMLVLLDGVLRRTGWLTSPLPPDTGDRFLEAFWRADHFSDRRGRDLLTGDANVFPFWLGIVPHDAGLRTALDALDAAGLARPLPLRYAARRDPRIEDRVQRWFVPDYQGTSIWTSLGAMYLVPARPGGRRGRRAAPRVVRRADRTRRDALGGAGGRPSTLPGPAGALRCRRGHAVGRDPAPGRHASWNGSAASPVRASPVVGERTDGSCLPG